MEWYREQIKALHLGFDHVSSHYGATIAQLQVVQANYIELHHHYKQHGNQLTTDWYEFQTTVEEIVNKPRQGGAAQRLLALKGEFELEIVCCFKQSSQPTPSDLSQASKTVFTIATMHKGPRTQRRRCRTVIIPGWITAGISTAIIAVEP